MRTFARMILAVASFSPAALAADSNAPVSFTQDLRPLLNATCNACHKPEKSKGDLDMTTYASLMKGGKHGPAVVPGQPTKSSIIEQIVGPEPEMPPEGDPLKKEQIALIERWIS